MAWMELPNGYFVDYWHASQHVTVHGTACLCPVGTQATSFGETALAVCASASPPSRCHPKTDRYTQAR